MRQASARSNRSAWNCIKEDRETVECFNETASMKYLDQMYNVLVRYFRKEKCNRKCTAFFFFGTMRRTGSIVSQRGKQTCFWFTYEKKVVQILQETSF